MKGTTIMHENTTLAKVPSDLRDWIDENRLVYFALEATQLVSHSTLAKFSGHSIENGSDAMMLTLLTYCYATGAYSSREIELSVTRDSAMQYICAGAQPEWNYIRTFRRRNRTHLHRALVELLTMAWRARELAVKDLEIAMEIPFDMDLQTLLTIEAGDRIDQAVQLDSITMDE